ncbi:hypothetical protein MBHK15_100091 [Marinobacter salarius]|nr:hypothetical protein MBHK15_100091 [Marinobacter salarius]
MHYLTMLTLEFWLRCSLVRLFLYNIEIREPFDYRFLHALLEQKQEQGCHWRIALRFLIAHTLHCRLYV